MPKVVRRIALGGSGSVLFLCSASVLLAGVNRCAQKSSPMSSESPTHEPPWCVRALHSLKVHNVSAGQRSVRIGERSLILYGCSVHHPCDRCTSHTSNRCCKSNLVFHTVRRWKEMHQLPWPSQPANIFTHRALKVGGIDNERGERKSDQDDDTHIGD